MECSKKKAVYFLGPEEEKEGGGWDDRKDTHTLTANTTFTVKRDKVGLLRKGWYVES